MKLKYIFASIVATLALAVSCNKEADHYLNEIQVSSSYISLPVAGGTASFTIAASDNWAFDKVVNVGSEKEPVMVELPTWLTASTLSGAAGESTVTLTATAGEGRSSELVISCAGKTQRINVIQGIATVSNATCAQIIAGPDSKTYRVTGVCTKIANTTYGNWYLNDGTGEVYIYGTLDAKGAEKNFLSLGIEEGDELTVEGPKTTYNGTVELVNVTVVKLNKSLIKVEATDPEDKVIEKEGGDLVVTLTNKGQNLGVEIPDDAKSWLGISNLAGNVVTLTAAPNEGGDRETTVVFKTTDGKKEYSCNLALTQKGAIKEVSVAEFLAAPVGTAQYKVTGVITKVAKADYGNVYVKDFSGEAYIYGIGAKGDFAKLGLKEGDIVTLVGQRGEYNGSAQMTKGQYVSHIAVTKVTVAEFLAAAEDKNVWYMVTGEVTKPTEENTKFDLETYGNLNLTDETGSVYVYGVSTGVGGETKKFGTLGVKEGDKLTIIGYRTSYKGLNQVGGGMYVSHKEGDADDNGGSEGGSVDTEFTSNVTWSNLESAYDDGLATVNGVAEVKTLKFGTSKKNGSATVTIPAGAKEVSFYAVGWAGSEAKIAVKNGETVLLDQAVAANAGASGNAPYTLTVAATDKFTVKFESALAAATELKLESTGRVILFRIQSK